MEASSVLKNKTIAVIGGINMDIGGTPAGVPVLHDSNIGSVTTRPGGVGRNIAHDLCLLGCRVKLIAPLGDDLNGQALLQHCREVGLDMSLAPVFPGASSSAYLYITEADGDMLIAVNAMEIVQRITPAFLEPLLPELNACAAVVLDANLSRETLEFLAAHITVPLFADAVSAAKVERLTGCLPHLRAFKPNRLEAKLMTGQEDPTAAAAALVAMGVQQVFISLGSDGILAADREQSVLVPAEHILAVNANGAGDAAAAAMVCACVLGLGLEDTARLANLAGAKTAASPDTNPADLGSILSGLQI